MNNIDLPSDKKFGLFFAFVFLLLSIYFYDSEGRFFTYFFISLSQIFLVLAVFRPNSLHVMNVAWMRLGNTMALVVSPLTLGVIFFFLIFPVALVFKIVGRDELGLKGLKVESYWKKYDSSVRGDLFRDQF